MLLESSFPALSEHSSLNDIPATPYMYSYHDSYYTAWLLVCLINRAELPKARILGLTHI